MALPVNRKVDTQQLIPPANINSPAPGGMGSVPNTIDSQRKGDSGEKRSEKPGYVETFVLFIRDAIVWVIRKLFCCFIKNEPVEKKSEVEEESEPTTPAESLDSKERSETTSVGSHTGSVANPVVDGSKIPAFGPTDHSSKPSTSTQEGDSTGDSASRTIGSSHQEAMPSPSIVQKNGSSQPNIPTSRSTSARSSISGSGDSRTIRAGSEEEEGDGFGEANTLRTVEGRERSLRIGGGAEAGASLASSCSPRREDDDASLAGSEYQSVCDYTSDDEMKKDSSILVPNDLAADRRIYERLKATVIDKDIVKLFETYFSEEDRNEIYYDLGKSVALSTWETFWNSEDAIKKLQIKAGKQMAAINPDEHLLPHLMSRFGQLVDDQDE